MLEKLEADPVLRAVAEEQAAAKGMRPPGIDVPDVVSHVWRWFWSLNRRRTQGPNPIGFAEIESWSRMTRTEVLPVEIEMLIAMDDAFITAAAERAEQRRTKAKSTKAKKR